MKTVKSRYIIYALVDPVSCQIRYIGKTSKSVHARLAAHIAPSNLKLKSHKNNWIRHLLSSGLQPIIVELDTADSIEDVNEAEITYIKLCRAIGLSLTNTTVGGDSGIGYSATEETRKKISAARRAAKPRILSAEHKYKISQSMLGKKLTNESREKLRLSKIGKKLSAHTRAKISVAMMGNTNWRKEEDDGDV